MPIPAPNRAATTAPAPATALSASTQPVRAGSGRSASTATRAPSAVKNERTTSRRAPNRRNQPRTGPSNPRTILARA
jgi:hypothetical protein